MQKRVDPIVHKSSAQIEWKTEQLRSIWKPERQAGSCLLPSAEAGPKDSR